MAEPPLTEPTIITLGCRLNAYESEVMREQARSAGLARTIVINTCAVTAEAVRQAMQTIRRQRREHPDARIVVTGCAVQIEPQRFADMPEVDHLLGNGEKTKADVWASLAIPQNERVQVADIMDVRETASHLVAGFPARARAFVQVQNGCDHRCTFCVIPFGRGPSRSVPSGAVVQQAARLVAAGYREIVLTGVDMTAYGADLPGRPTLGRLVRQILRHVPALERLRLSSIDQVEADAELVRAIAEEPRLMPHLHLSLQSGSDLILKRMKRRHGRADAIRFCDEVRRLRPDVAFGADLIAGFPTETEAMFEETLDLAERCGLAYLHVFPFSARRGTPAARMPQLPRHVVKSRAERLRQKGAALLQRHLSGQVGRKVGVLMERDGLGRTDDFAEIEVAGATAGSVVAARVTGTDGARLIGEVAA
jgi:threonylcarbamoyladenosine tRNA methylthiotransferase MtaB